jgi:hypothetical protein
VIGSVLPAGRDVGGLLRYLFREGRAVSTAWRRPHRAAADRRVGQRPRPARAGTDAGGRRDVRALAGLLHAPLTAANVDPATKPVYHLAVAAAKDPRTGALRDRPLTDGQWADIAAEYLHQLGLARRGDEQAVRWVAVRHADDHIHVVATLARQDGRRVFPRNDHYRAREASLTVEARYGLIRTSPRAGPAPARRAAPRPASTRRSRHDAGSRDGPGRPRRTGRCCGSSCAPPRAARPAGTTSPSTCAAGVHVRARMSERNPGQVTGYAVALPTTTTGGRRSGSAAASSRPT